MSGPNTDRRDAAFIEVLFDLDVGAVEISDDGFIGVIGHTGLSMRIASPDDLDTVRVWVALSAPDGRLRPGQPIAPDAMLNNISDFVNVLNRNARSGARYFQPGVGATGNRIVAEAVIVYADERNDGALAHAMRLCELDVNGAVRLFARVFS